MWTSGKHLIIPRSPCAVKPFRAFSLRGDTRSRWRRRRFREELDAIETNGVVAIDPDSVIEIVRRLAEHERDLRDQMLIRIDVMAIYLTPGDEAIARPDVDESKLAIPTAVTVPIHRAR